jgi:hypothetical protein
MIGLLRNALGRFETRDPGPFILAGSGTILLGVVNSSHKSFRRRPFNGIARHSVGFAVIPFRKDLSCKERSRLTDCGGATQLGAGLPYCETSRWNNGTAFKRAHGNLAMSRKSGSG